MYNNNIGMMCASNGQEPTSFRVAEDHEFNSPIGRLLSIDADEGENAMPYYFVIGINHHHPNHSCSHTSFHRWG